MAYTYDLLEFYFVSCSVIFFVLIFILVIFLSRSTILQFSFMTPIVALYILRVNFTHPFGSHFFNFSPSLFIRFNHREENVRHVKEEFV